VPISYKVNSSAPWRLNGKSFTSTTDSSIGTVSEGHLKRALAWSRFYKTVSSETFGRIILGRIFQAGLNFGRN
jgi:hypothetical protein